MFYIILLLIIIFFENILVMKLRISRNSKRLLFLLLVFVEISLFLGMRDPFSGTDTLEYLRYYYDAGTSSVIARMHFGVFERGYAYLNKLVYWIFGYHPTVLFTIIGALSIGPVLWTLRKSEYLLISVLTWCIVNGLNTAIANLRQGLALGWCILAYYLLLERKYWSSLIMILIATSFHLSAICMLIIFPLYYLSKKIKFTPIYLFGIIFPATMVIIILVKPFLELLISASGVYTSYLTRHNQGIGSILYCIFTFFIFMITYLSYNCRQTQLSTWEKTNFKFLLIMNLVGFVLYTATIGGGSTRMALYFTSIYIWTLPLLPSTFRNPAFRAITVCSTVMGLICILLIFCCFPSGFANEASSYTPFFISR